MHKVIQILPSLVPITSDPHALPIPSLRIPWNSPSPHPKYLRSLKNSMGKATGLNNISNEMLRLVGPLHLPFLTNLFNQIYSTPCFPSIWKQAYISTLHKRGAKQDPANYCLLSITSCLGKLFTGVLNECLMAFMIRKNSAHHFQGAFTRGRRGTDHIFLTNTLIRLNSLVTPYTLLSLIYKKPTTVSAVRSCLGRWSWQFCSVTLSKTCMLTPRIGSK